MEIIEIETENLKPAEYNPRKWDKKSIEDLTESIKRFGLVDPIIVNSAENRNGIIIGGHFRYKIAKDLGYKKIPVVYIDIPDIEKEKELNLRLNKNLGEWDWDLLKNFEEDLLKDIGFSNEELDKLLSLEEDDFDAETEYQKIEEPKSKYGEVYQLGQHRLMCGDSTKHEDVEKLMDGKKADMVFTDPPYNVNYDYNVRYFDGRKKRLEKKAIINDKKSPKEFQQFIESTFKNAFDFTKDTSPFYCWYATKTDNEFKNGIQNVGWYISQVIIWLKENITFSTGQDYHRIYEPCFFGWKRGNKHFVNKQFTGKWKEVIQLEFGDFTEQLDIIYQHRDNAKEYQHPTQKPVRLAEKALKKHSNQDSIVLDLFGGSGSTLIACEQMNRICYTMELDPKYCDVIRSRYEKFINK